MVAGVLFSAGVATLRSASVSATGSDPEREAGLPALVTDLPAGDADRGRSLFWTRHGCALCHGDPTLPGSELRAPDLSSIAVDGATRVPGKSAAQYVYESITDPDAYHAEAPVARDGTKLESMPVPELTEQEAADLVAFLLRPSAEARPPSASPGASSLR